MWVSIRAAEQLRSWSLREGGGRWRPREVIGSNAPALRVCSRIHFTPLLRYCLGQLGGGDIKRFYSLVRRALALVVTTGVTSK